MVKEKVATWNTGLLGRNQHMAGLANQLTTFTAEFKH